MGGITGIFAFNLVGKFHRINITAATTVLSKRGPDFQDIYFDDWAGLGHRRLCVIDTSEKAHQPMWDDTGRFAIVFNGEIFNYRQLRNELSASGETFHSQSDTEVLLKLYIRDGEACLPRLNGFFAFCIYDKREQSFFIARDRYGEKPLFYAFDEDKFIFASELKSLMHYGVEREIDFASLITYLQLNYIPGPATIFRHIYKLLPGHYLKVANKRMEVATWYTLPAIAGNSASPSWDQAKQQLVEFLDQSVRDRLIADVPLGSLLSGGINSSIVAGLAKRYKDDLQTFSLRLHGAAFFDETRYATLAARHFKTDHAVITLTDDDMLAHLVGALDYMDEPFADPSALNLYVLSREVRKQVTVALAGNGADEIFAGYDKHQAFLRALRPGLTEKLIINFGGVWKLLPQSGRSIVSDRIRRLSRFADGASLPPPERHWRWTSGATLPASLALLHPSIKTELIQETAEQRRRELTASIGRGDMNSILRTDMSMVLPNDRLVKTDSMSMANSLELRNPFLDHRVVDFAFSLPSSYKITARSRKHILREAFRDLLPAEIIDRKKKEFEVPLRLWLRRDLRQTVNELLDRDRIEGQRIFDGTEIERLRRKLFSANPGDSHARIWTIVIFQWWWKKNMESYIAHPT